MPDGTVPSSTEALRAALSAARASLERQLRASRTDAADDALRQIKSALRLLPAGKICDIPDIAWVESDPVALSHASSVGTQLTPADPPALDTDAPSSADDLTRIRGINDVLARRLAALGIQRFAQIAAWQPDDVRAIADAMGLGRRFLAMGIVDQAADLERARVEKLTKDQVLPVTPTSTGLQSVAIWEPKGGADRSASQLVRAPTAWKPLNGDTLSAVLSVIRTKRPMNIIINLADVAPVLAQPIYIATDYDAATELPRWRTGVLVPFVEAREAPDLTKTVRQARIASTGIAFEQQTDERHSLAAAKVQPTQEAAKAIAAFHAAVAAAAVPAPTRVQPLHEQASLRIDDLEAELEQMSRRTETVDRHDRDARHAADEARSREAPRIAQPAADSRAASTFGSLDDVPEADVKIVVGARGKAPLLAPLPDLPLTARSSRMTPSDEATGDIRPTYGHVEEAAVVIVRRNSAEPAAAGLAFYAKRPEATGPVRRFMRALAGG